MTITVTEVRAFAAKLGSPVGNLSDAYVAGFIDRLRALPDYEVFFMTRTYYDATAFEAALKEALSD